MIHVLTYPEILEAANKGAVIYEEHQGKDRVRPMKFDGVDFVALDKSSFLLLMECDEEDCEDYNLYYRCWSDMPSDELRAATPWKENPYKFLTEDSNA